MIKKKYISTLLTMSEKELSEGIEQINSNNENALTLEEEYTPKLFSEDTTSEEENNSSVPLFLISSLEKLQCIPEPFQSPVFGFG